MRELLVIADKRSNTHTGFVHALEIAQNTGAKIEFVGFVYAAGVDGSEVLTHQEKRKVRDTYVDKKKQKIKCFLASLDLKGVVVDIDVVWEKSLESWVVQRCEQKSFDLVFKTGNRTEAFLYTPSDWQLMRNCPDPVMIIGEKPWRKGGKVLAALDLGAQTENSWQLNKNIVNLSVAIAYATNSEIHACYSVTRAGVLGARNLETDDYFKKILKSIDPIIRNLLKSKGMTKDRLHIVSGNPVNELCRTISAIDADLVVVGKRTRASLRGLLLGATSENVLHVANADVLVTS